MIDITLTAEHWKDEDGKPAGGVTNGTGLTISWQNGPLGRHDLLCIPGGTCSPRCNRKEPNGAFVESVIAAAHDRLAWYQTSEFACAANKEAMRHLSAAIDILNARTADREKRKVEGTHKK